MIEKDTNYSFMLEAERPLNFQKIKAVSDQFILNLPKKLKKKLLDGLDHNIQLLNTEPVMAANLYVFGEAQEAWLKKAYSCLPKDFFKKEIEIIDYNCGQGVAEIVYNDFLQNNNLRQKIRRVTLIDPSEIALRRAGLHTKFILPDVELSIVCKNILELKTEDIASTEKLSKLHLLTNIPGLGVDAMVHLSKVIKTGISGLNYFICLCPYSEETAGILRLLDTFINMMNPDQEQKYAEDLDASKSVATEKIHCSLRIFVKDEIKDGEFILDKNVKYWVNRDKVKYNEDKTVLIKCSRLVEGEYILPNAIQAIDPKAFRGCENLTTITAENTHFISVDGVLYSRDMSRIIKYPQAKPENSFVIPDTIHEIAPYAFAGCTQLRKVILPDSLMKLGFGAFEYCVQLTNITIPESVVRIEGSVFSSCSSLAVVDFNAIHCGSMENLETDNDGILCREAWTFEGCTSLNTINIGQGVTVIPDFAFSFCEYVFAVDLPESVRSIGKNAFSYCKQLKEITLTKSITSIGKDAFFWCKNLRTIWIPKGMSLHFKKYTALKELTSLIKEKEGDEEDKLLTSPRVFDAIADAVETIEVIEHATLKQSKTKTSKSSKKTHSVKKDQRKKTVSQKTKTKTVDAPIKKTSAKVSSPKKKQPLKKEQKEAANPVIGRMHELAEQGNAKIQNKLGYLYETGSGVEKDSIEAVKWYRKAAEQGNAKAQFNLAKQYALGCGVEQSDKEAAKWYLSAANQELVNAMTNLGAMYATGRGVEKNEAKAIEWYQKAAQKGDPIAIHNLQKRGIKI